VANVESLLSISQRNHELESRLASWEEILRTARELKTWPPAADLAKLRDEKERLAHPPVPERQLLSLLAGRGPRSPRQLPEGPRTDEGVLPRVNDPHRARIRRRRPPTFTTVSPATSGVDACANCHDAAKSVWDKNRAMLARTRRSSNPVPKEFKPRVRELPRDRATKSRWSTVTMNASFRTCRRVVPRPRRATRKKPDKAEDRRDPKPNLCATSCHHPRRRSFDAAKAKQLIIGPRRHGGCRKTAAGPRGPRTRERGHNRNGGAPFSRMC